MLVNTLDILSNYKLDPGTHFGVGRLLAAGTFTAPLAADGTDEAALLDVTASNRQHVVAFEAQVGNLAERLIEIETIMRGGNLVG